MSAEPYVSIACAFHESLEFAVLRRIPLHLCYRDMTGEHEIQVLPTDVATREGAEWLSYVGPQGNAGVVRLDRIVKAEPITAA